jgi:uncharacterized RDD family membrane protein YckC
MTSAQKPNTWLRIASLLLEWFIMFSIVMVFSIPAMNHDSYGLYRITHEAYKLDLLHDYRVYLSLAGFALVFCKDCINGQSIAKRIIKIQVVDRSTGAVASPMQCFTRNISLLLFPLEILAVLAEPDRRIGDKIAGTQIVLYNPVTKNNPGHSPKKYLLPLLLAYAIPLALSYFLSTISFGKPVTALVPASYNQIKSKALEKSLNEYFNEYYSASVKYYDSIENKYFDYVSIICSMKEVVSAKSALTYQQLEDQTVSLVYALFPKEQVHGKMRVVYRKGNDMTTWNHIFGERFSGDEE